MENEFQSIYIFSASVGQEPYITYNYQSEEKLARRKNIFTENYNYINECNRKYCGFKCRIYSSTERTEDEFMRNFGMGKVDQDLDNYMERMSNEVSNVIMGHQAYTRQSWDWEKQGGVTEVGDQGDCGSSAAWAVVTAVETCFWNTRKGGMRKPVVSLSKKEMYECG